MPGNMLQLLVPIPIIVWMLFAQPVFSRDTDNTLLWLLSVLLSNGILVWSWLGVRLRNVNGDKVRESSNLRGEVQNFRERTETKGSNNPYAGSTSTIVWTFNLVRFEEGEQLPPIPVQMRGHSFSGFINDGDTVALLDRWKARGLHRTKRVLNLTTGVTVRAKKRVNIGTVISMIIVLAIIAFVIVAALSQ